MKATILTVLLMTSLAAAADWEKEMQRANSLQQERRYDEAGDAYQSALKAAAGLDARDWRRAQAANNYAAHLYERGDYADAERYYAQAIKGFEEAGQQVNEATAMCNLAVLHRVTGRYADAISNARAALRIYSEQLPGGSPQLVSCNTNLAEALNGAGRTAEAEAAARTAVADAEALGNPGKLRLAHALHVLGNVLHSGGRSEQALPVLQRALSIRRAGLGERHPSVATTLGTYSAALLRTGDLAAADAMASESVDILQSEFGGEHIHLVGALNNLAQIRAMSDAASAEPLFRRALSIAEKRLGAGHPDTARVQSNLAGWYLAAGRLRAAETMFRQARATLEATVGKAHPACRAAEEGLADVYARLGRVTEARTLRRASQSFRPEP